MVRADAERGDWDGGRRRIGKRRAAAPPWRAHRSPGMLHAAFAAPLAAQALHPARQAPPRLGPTPPTRRAALF